MRTIPLYPDTLQVKMNSDLDKIQTWLKVNKLTLNVKKTTKYMLIESRPKLDLVSNNFAVKVDNIPIERVTVYKSLEVSVDENLTWKALILKKFQRRYQQVCRF